MNTKISFVILCLVSVIFLFLVIELSFNPKIHMNNDARQATVTVALLTIVPLLWITGVKLLKQMYLEKLKKDSSTGKEL